MRKFEKVSSTGVEEQTHDGKADGTRSFFLSSSGFFKIFVVVNIVVIIFCINYVICGLLLLCAVVLLRFCPVAGIILMFLLLYGGQPFGVYLFFALYLPIFLVLVMTGLGAEKKPKQVK